MNRRIVRLMALVAAVGFGACGESSDLVMGELNEAEAQDLAGAVLFATFNASGEVPQSISSVDGPQAVPFAFATEIETDVECPLGGMVGVAASVEVSGNTDSEAAHVEYSMTQIHDGCVVMSENDIQFTLWGNPDMSAAFAVENNGQGVVEWGGSVQGAIDWMTDGREGTCEVDFEFSGRQETEASVAGDVDGTICGFSILQSFSIG